MICASVIDAVHRAQKLRPTGRVKNPAILLSDIESWDMMAEVAAYPGATWKSFGSDPFRPIDRKPPVDREVEYVGEIFGVEVWRDLSLSNGSILVVERRS